MSESVVNKKNYRRKCCSMSIFTNLITSVGDFFKNLKMNKELEQICRLCSAKTLSAKNIFYNPELIKKSIWRKIRTYLNVIIKESDKLRVICEMCVEKLQEFSLYHEMVKETQKMLSIYLNDPEEDKTLLDFNAALHPSTNHLQTIKDKEKESDFLLEYATVTVETEAAHQTLCCNDPLSIKHECETNKNQDTETDEHQSSTSLTNKDIKEELFDENSTLETNDDNDSTIFDLNSESDSLQLNTQSSKTGHKKFDPALLLEIETEDFKFPKRLIKDGLFKIPAKYRAAVVEKYFSLTCDICSDKNHLYNDLPTLLSHYEESHNVKGYVVCCERKFYDVRDMALHVAKHLQPNAFKTCKECGMEFIRPHSLKIHLQTHLPEDDRSYRCSKCPRAFNTRAKLTTHLKLHKDGTSIYVCKKCEKAYSSGVELAKHNAQVHLNGICKYACGVCEKQFNTFNKIAYHGLSHETKVQCGICKKWLKNRNILTQHMSSHSTERKYICEICKKRYTSKRYLTKHMLSHSTERKYCHLCTYSTLNEINLAGHLNSHTEQKLHLCEECGASFKMKVYLKKHMAQHEGIKKFSCEFCSRQFLSKSNYFAHRKRIHHKEWLALQKKRIERQMKSLELKIIEENLKEKIESRN